LGEPEQKEILKRTQEMREEIKQVGCSDLWDAISKILSVRHKLADIYQFVDLIGLNCFELKEFLPFLLHNI
jgi:hypothetical protein